MTKEEFELKIKEVRNVVFSYVNDDGVQPDTFLYRFLVRAFKSLDLAVTCVNDEYESV